ncbi:MAG: hypothetical protein HYY64_15525 [Candidatus Rokubacteria bacterium]|nr:hypothetical protein [Candidatus Rokubacteria bacterium]
MRDVLVLTALELEARVLARQLELRPVSRLGFPAHELERSPASGGLGRLRLAPVGLRAALLSDRWPALTADLRSPLVISAGTCGALAPELEVSDLLLPESVLGLDGERLNVTPGAHAAALRLAPGARQGLLLTSRDAVGTPEEKAERFHATAAAAVDLESALILAWAARQGCPSLVVRAVSDTARQHLPSELGRVVTPEGRIPVGRAVALFLTHPRTIPHALLLQRGTWRALQAVARLLAALIE